MSKVITPRIYSDTNPTSSENIASGYVLGQKWFNSTTGVEYIHKADGVWESFSNDPHFISRVAMDDVNQINNSIILFDDNTPAIYTYEVSRPDNSINNSVLINSKNTLDGNGVITCGTDIELDAKDTVSSGRSLIHLSHNGNLSSEATTDISITAPTIKFNAAEGVQFNQSPLIVRDSGNTPYQGFTGNITIQGTPLYIINGIIVNVSTT